MYEANGTPTNGNTTQTNEAVLLRRAIAGDQEALEILFAKNNRSLCQTAIRLSLAEADTALTGRLVQCGARGCASPRDRT